MDHQTTGRLGGIARARNNSLELLKQISRKGGLNGKGVTRSGRPHNPTLEQLMVKQPTRLTLTSQVIKTKTRKPSKNLKDLKKAFIERLKSINTSAVVG